MKILKNKWVVRIAVFALALICIYFADRRRINTKKIYVVGQDRFKDMVPSNPKRFTDRKVPNKKTITLNGEKLELIYQCSYSYQIGQSKQHRYIVDGNEEQAICFGDDGKIKKITYDYMHIDINSWDDANTVLEVLKPQLEKDFDLSDYKHVDMSVKKEQVGGKISSYSFVFYNEINGYCTSSFSAQVKSDGGVRIWVGKLKAMTFPLYFVNERKLERALDKKLKELYTNDDYQYISFEYNDEFQEVLMFRNELCLYLHVNVKYYDLETEREKEWQETIVVPVHMITY